MSSSSPVILDYETTCVYLATLLRSKYPSVWRDLTSILEANTISLIALEDVPQVWLRDFLPVQVGDSSFARFRYEPDYLDHYKHLVPDERVFQRIAHLGRFITSDINLDGGNVVAARDKVILTEKIVRENPRYERKELVNALLRLFRVPECILIPYEEAFDPVGHADGIVRFLDEDTVLINEYGRVNRAYGKRLRASIREHHLACEELPYYIEKGSTDGIPSAVGCFINYLQVKGLIVVPIFGSPQDEAALKRLDALWPGTRIVPVRCEDLARQGGALRCCSWAVRHKVQNSTSL
jgi:agmatine deiminase